MITSTYSVGEKYDKNHNRMWKTEMVIAREFDTARELVFKVHIYPEISIQWHGPCRPTMTYFMHIAQLDQVPHIVEV
jgi:hypothetical protein